MNVRVPNRWRGVRPFKRHSLVLVVAGLVYIGIGVAYIGTTPTGDRLDALYYAVYVMDFEAWGLVWIAVGLMSIISARWPPVSETWGYTVLTGMSSAWAAFYLAGIWFHDAPITSYTAVATWVLIAFLWWAISGLVNPDALERVLSR